MNDLLSIALLALAVIVLLRWATWDQDRRRSISTTEWRERLRKLDIGGRKR